MALAACLLALTLQPAVARDGAGADWGGTVEVKPARPAAAPAAKPPSAARRPTGEGPGSGGATSGPDNGQAVAGAPPAADLNIVSDYVISGDATRTLIAFDLIGPADVAARSLANPPRVILDLSQVDFRLPPGAGQSGQGLVSAFRFGLIEAGKSRIVIDTPGPVRIERAEIVLPQASANFRLEVELIAATEAEQAAAEMAEVAAALKPSLPAEVTAPPRTTARALRPVIVVDPGHGGIDPGATGSRGPEKAVVLDVGLALRQALVATRRYEVVMTRVTDVFISLEERVRLSRHHQADLFVSLHADAQANRDSNRIVRGATVYTLAEQASDDNARRLADKENAVDLLAGLPLQTVGDDQVRSFLLDLMRRESIMFSNNFSKILVSELQPKVLLSREPARSAPFRVLRQPGTAAALVELGYMSDAKDEEIMLDPEWQAKVAKAIVAAIDRHFAQRGGGGGGRRR